MRASLLIFSVIIFYGCFLPQRVRPIPSGKVTNELRPPVQKGEDGFIVCDFGIGAAQDDQWRTFKKYLEKNLQRDSLALDTIPPGEYKALIRFIIDKDGKIAVAEIGKDPGYGLGQRAKEVVLHYPGTWEPAEQNGRKVKAFCVQPVTFIIEQEDDETPACSPAPEASNI